MRVRLVYGALMKLCTFCSRRLTSRQKKFCSYRCNVDWRVVQIQDNWLKGNISGLKTNGVVIPAVKRWLRDTYGDKCSNCGWNKVNPYTNKVPIVADHIDGDWTNNRPENLRLLCPNCDSLGPTYKGANKGKGRSVRLVRK